MGICEKWFSSWRVGEVQDTLARKAERLAGDYEPGQVPESVALLRAGYGLACDDLYDLLNDEHETDIREVLELAGCTCGAKDAEEY